MEGQQPRQIGRPTSAASTSATDSRARQGPTDLFQRQVWSHWLRGSTDYSAGIHPLESTWNGSATEGTTNAGGGAAEAEQGLRPRNTSSATAAGGETSNGHCARRWERRWAGKQADADRCRSRNCFPWKNATKQWSTSWRLLNLWSSCPDEWRYGGDPEADSGPGGSGDGGIYPFLFVPFLFSLCVQFSFAVVQSLKFHIYISPGMKQ